MINPIIFKASVAYNKKVEQNPDTNSANPLRLKTNLSTLAALSNYNQVLLKPKFDKERAEIENKIKELNQLVPQKLIMPYSFKINEINGERIYNKDGTLSLIREYENDIVREYYPSENKAFVNKILERDKNNGKIRSQIEPIIKNDTIKANVIIFDEQINNKYTILQVEADNTISNITEILNGGKNFRSLFKNPQTLSPERFIESKENDEGEFETTECKMNPNIQEIKITTTDKEISIKYSENHKTIDVKNL